MNTTDMARNNSNFFTSNEAIELIGASNTVLDPASLLIARSVMIGTGNIFYPNVTIQSDKGGLIEIGNNNTFYPGTFVICSSGVVQVGDGNSLGPAGCTIQVSGDSMKLEIGSDGRYCNGANIIGQGSLGSGSQILGNITVQNCILASGGGFSEADPDKRAAVLKGFGLARGLELEMGQVVNGSGDFAKAAVEWQRSYHPKPS